MRHLLVASGSFLNLPAVSSGSCRPSMGLFARHQGDPVSVSDARSHPYIHKEQWGLRGTDRGCIRLADTALDRALLTGHLRADHIFSAGTIVALIDQLPRNVVP